SVVRSELRSGGLDEAVSRYRRLRISSPDRYDFSEIQLNELGYGLLRDGMVDEALAVLRLNLDEFPESANAHDSLAEASEAAGDTETAVELYRRALELDPEFEHAAERLDELSRR
ncbi:MAG: tetratricopeptide repeat protein, partial [Candidatus Eisenbacteria bacterium]|nr:tetratricopeptide repeat protein [Candidatus Eisenbacteria bacterium]